MSIANGLLTLKAQKKREESQRIKLICTNYLLHYFNVDIGLSRRAGNQFQQ